MARSECVTVTARGADRPSLVRFMDGRTRYETPPPAVSDVPLETSRALLERVCRSLGASVPSLPVREMNDEDKKIIGAFEHLRHITREHTGIASPCCRVALGVIAWRLAEYVNGECEPFLADPIRTIETCDCAASVFYRAIRAFCEVTK